MEYNYSNYNYEYIKLTLSIFTVRYVGGFRSIVYK